QRRIAIGCYSAIIRYRNYGWRDDETYRSKHDNPNQKIRSFLYSGRQSAIRRNSRIARRAPDGGTKPHLRTLPVDGYPAVTTWCSSDRGDFLYRCQRYHHGFIKRYSNRQGAEYTYRSSSWTFGRGNRIMDNRSIS